MRTFTPDEIDKMTSKEVRTIYKQYKKNANKRITNLAKRGYYVRNNSPFYGGFNAELRLTADPRNAFKFPDARNLTDYGTREMLAEVSRWLRDPAHTVRGEKRQREFMIGQLQKRGVTNINNKNFYEFTEFMEAIREQYGGTAYDSGDAADVWNNAQRIGIKNDDLIRHYNSYADNLEKLSRLKPARTERGATYQEVIKKIKRIK